MEIQAKTICNKLYVRERKEQRKRQISRVYLEIQTVDTESPLDCKEIQPVHPKGYQSWVFIGRTDVEAETLLVWPPDAKS